jgi:hypothetical protein
LAFAAATPSLFVFSLSNTSQPLNYFDFQRTCHQLPRHTSPMGNTQAKLSALPEQAKRDANHNSLKRSASPASLDACVKRRAFALDDEVTDHTTDGLSHFSKDKKPCEALRDSLDEDEKFLELPQLFDLVSVVAEKHGMDDGLLHRNYRGQDLLTALESKSGQWTILMSKVRTFRPVTAIANSVDIGTGKQHKQEIFVMGRENEEDAQWLNVSYHLDTQVPHVVLRISAPSMRDSHGKYEPAYVYIFATNLAQAPSLPLRTRTGKRVSFSKRRAKRLTDVRPRLLKKSEEGLLTETSLQLNRVDKGATDVDGRLSRPIIVSSFSPAQLDRMTAEIAEGNPDQPAHERLLGLIHGDKIRDGLDLYTEYEGENVGREHAREVNFCKMFRLAMIICNELGNFWAYRLQFPDISWTDKNFPFDKLQPPRWTVRKWFARGDKSSDGQAVVAATPAQWQAINRPKVLPGDEEESFLSGLDAAADDSTSMRLFVRKDFNTATGHPKVLVRTASGYDVS